MPYPDSFDHPYLPQKLACAALSRAQYGSRIGNAQADLTDKRTGVARKTVTEKWVSAFARMAGHVRRRESAPH
jgi:hypothetical protein